MRPFTVIAVVLLALMAVLQVVRVARGWSLVVNGYALPLSFSLIAGVVLAALAVMVWRER